MRENVQMVRYKDWAPSAFDSKGLCSDDVGADWFVSSCTIERNTMEHHINKINWDYITEGLKKFSDEGENWAIHRFGHWMVGWIEIIVVKPNTKEMDFLQECENRMDGYPILDDDEWSKREDDYCHTSWEKMSLKDRIDFCYLNDLSIFAARTDDWGEISQLDDNGSMRDSMIGSY